MIAKVIRFAGETGLRPPGSLLTVTEEKGAELERKGLVEIQKDMKQNFETKEEKFHPETKKRGRKQKNQE